LLEKDKDPLMEAAIGSARRPAAPRKYQQFTKLFFGQSQ